MCLVYAFLPAYVGIKDKPSIAYKYIWGAGGDVGGGGGLCVAESV